MCSEKRSAHSALHQKRIDEKSFRCAKIKFGLSEKHTKFEKIFLVVWTFTK
jgi:hypothetical protein